MEIDRGWEIVPGCIVINEVYLVVDHDDVKVYEVDLRSKYPGMIMHCYADDMIVASIYAREETLHVDESKKSEPTDIGFEIDNASDWLMVTDGSRYTVRIVLYRRKEEEEE